jgi:thiamine-phosphate pyrophosphorylase
MAAISERLAWWDELFELPSVAFAATLEEAGVFAGAGADFILAADFIWTAPEGPLAALRAAKDIIRKAHAALPVKAEVQG